MRHLSTLAAIGLLIAAPALGAVGNAPDEIARLQAEYRDEAARARRLRADAAEAEAEVADLERRLSGLRREMSGEDRQLSLQRDRLRELSAREAVLVAQLSRARARHSRLLGALQMMTRRPPPPLLVPADRAVDTVRAAILMTAMAPALQAQGEGLTGRQAELGRVRRLAVLGSERLFTTESDQGDQRAELEGQIARKSDLRTVLDAEATEAERAAAVLERRLLALGGTVPVPDRETARTATRLPGGRSRLTPPVAGAPIQRFGGSSRGWRWAATGGPVRAPAAARVVHAGALEGWGRVVILDLGPGWQVVLAGLASVSVATGDRVGDGQTLGTAGASGDIYIELRRDERPVDPSPWLR